MPTPTPCRWPGCNSRSSGRHKLCARDRMRAHSLGADPGTDAATLAALWAEKQNAATVKRAALYSPGKVQAVECKAPGCARPARTHGWCDACQKLLGRMEMDRETTTPEAFAEAKVARLAARAPVPAPKPQPRPTRVKDAARRLRDDLRRAFGMDDGVSDDEIVARAEKAVADLAAQAHAAGELVTLADRHADAATVALAERDVLAERVAAAEGRLELAAMGQEVPRG